MPSVENILSGLAGDHATGSLRLGKAGVIYLTDGRVTYAESASAPRLEDLLGACRGISAHAVRQIRQATTRRRPDPALPPGPQESRKSREPQPTGGERLIAQGLLTRGELEFCVLSTVLDAAYFLLRATGHRPRFRRGELHWLGPQWYFDATGLLRECERRKAQLEQIWPSAELDTLPVVPVERIGAHRVVLSALQWEVLVGADSVATPAELARKLGRPAYSVLLAVRQLASSGLLRVLEPGPAEAPAAPDPLPRRTKGATEIPAAGTGSVETSEWIPRANGDPADVNLLIRLRNALEAMT
ncbi:hypothetical protein [Streptosporangium sp. NPDC000509]|uniref:hypothetical protein n=1 Tax=Streptosporangium sp. NPDC000509 TaxID=3366186 RepID=UPI0036C51490